LGAALALAALAHRGVRQAGDPGRREVRPDADLDLLVAETWLG